jgi:hypothetical protein
MAKYNIGDDGKVIDGKIIVFLKPPRYRGEPASDEDGGSADAPEDQSAGAADHILEGILHGAYGPLRNWPFRVVHQGRYLGPDLDGGRSANPFEDGVWKTDPEGRYRFEDPPAGDVHIEVLLPGSEPVRVLEGALQGAYGPLRNWPFQLLHGGQPVNAQGLHGAETSNPFRDDTWWSDEHGCYRFEGLPGDDYEIEVLLPGTKEGEP